MLSARYGRNRQYCIRGGVDGAVSRDPARDPLYVWDDVGGPVSRQPGQLLRCYPERFARPTVASAAACRVEQKEEGENCTFGNFYEIHINIHISHIIYKK